MRRNEGDDTTSEYFINGLRITAEPGWHEIDHGYEDPDPAPLMLHKASSGSVLQFSVPNPRDDGGITLEELRYWMKDMIKMAKLRRGFDAVEAKGTHLVCAQSFPGTSRAEFNRLWYWSDRKRLVMVTYGRSGGPDEEDLRECERMIATMRF